MDGELRQLFRQHVRGFFQAIESGGVGSGIPDLHYCLKYNKSGWIECKRTSANAVVISPFQIAWAEALWRVGGRAFVAVRQHAPAGKRKLACDVLWMLHGEGARALHDGGLSNVAPQHILGKWPGGPARWDWQHVERILRS